MNLFDVRHSFLQQGMCPVAESAPESQRRDFVNVAEMANDSRAVGKRFVIGASATHLLGAIEWKSESPVCHCIAMPPFGWNGKEWDNGENWVILTLTLTP